MSQGKQIALERGGGRVMRGRTYIDRLLGKQEIKLQKYAGIKMRCDRR